MAEESPQNSSESQNTLEESDVIAEEQQPISIEGTTNARGLQSSQGNLSSSNQVIDKDYDLGILLVHGIGFQEQGDTIEAIYPSIIDELESDESIAYEIIDCKKNVDDRCMKIIHEDKEGDVVFRELYWHRKEIDCDSISASIKPNTIADFPLAISLFIRIGCLKLTQIRWGTPIFFASLMLGIFVFSSQYGSQVNNLYNILEGRIVARVGLVFAIPMFLSVLIFLFNLLNLMEIVADEKQGVEGLIKYLIDSLLKWKWLPLISVGIYFIVSVFYIFLGNIHVFANFHLLHVVGFCIFFLSIIAFFMFNPAINEFWGQIKKLWNQIDESADYIRVGGASEYVDFVKSEIKKLSDECGKVAIVAHSMGEYLSYKSLEEMDESVKRNVCLISFGGGLGAVSIIGKSKLNNKEKKYSRSKTISWSWLMALISLLALLGHLYSWCGICVDIWRILPETQNNEHLFLIEPFETQYNLCIHVAGILASCGLAKWISWLSGTIPPGDGFKFYRYTHFFDPVGNFSSFAYDSRIKTFLTPKLWIGHGVDTYFFSRHKDWLATKSLTMKYMQQQVVFYVKNIVFGVDGWRNDQLGLVFNRGSKLHIAAKIIISLFAVLLGEYIGILLGFSIGQYSGFEYNFGDMYKYMIIFLLFEYWVMRVGYKLYCIYDMHVSFLHSLFLAFGVALVGGMVASTYGWSVIVNVINIIQESDHL